VKTISSITPCYNKEDNAESLFSFLPREEFLANLIVKPLEE